MPPTMVTFVPHLTGYAVVRHIAVSLPLVEALLDEPGGKYMLPSDVPPRESRDLRRMRYGRAPATPRGPTLRTLVKRVVARDADQEAKRQLQKYEREARLAREAEARLSMFSLDPP